MMTFWRVKKSLVFILMTVWKGILLIELGFSLLSLLDSTGSWLHHKLVLSLFKSFVGSLYLWGTKGNNLIRAVSQINLKTIHHVAV